MQSKGCRALPSDYALDLQARIAQTNARMDMMQRKLQEFHDDERTKEDYVCWYYGTHDHHMWE
jgi:hypothetical protein